MRMDATAEFDDPSCPLRFANVLGRPAEAKPADETNYPAASNGISPVRINRISSHEAGNRTPGLMFEDATEEDCCSRAPHHPMTNPDPA